MRVREIAAVLSVAALAGCGAGITDTAWHGNVDMRSGWLNWQAVGFGYNYNGYVTLQFSPPIPAGVTLSAVLNGASIGGQATTDGSDSLHIAVSGSSLACQMTDPSTYVVFVESAPANLGLKPVLAQLDFNWGVGTLC